MVGVERRLSQDLLFATSGKDEEVLDIGHHKAHCGRDFDDGT